MIKSKRQVFLVIILFIFMLMLGTVTYAFFNYTRTGNSNTLTVGRISFISRQTKTINLTDAFPISRNKVSTDTDNVGTFELEIEGDTDYNEGIEYLISIENAHINTTSGKKVPISLDVTVTNLGTSTDSYFTARNSKNATIYKRLTGNSIVGDQQLLVGYIKPNTTSGTKEGVNGKIVIKAFLDNDKIAISDTIENGDIYVPGYENGTDYTWIDGRAVLTTSEFNTLSTNGITFDVKV